MDLFGVMSAYLAHLNSLTPWDHLGHALGGVVGTGLYAGWANPVIRRPRWDPDAGTLDLGFFGLLMVGIGVAVIADTHFVVSVVAAAFGPRLAQAIGNRLIPGAADLIRFWARMRSMPQQGYSGYYGGGYPDPSGGYGGYSGGMQGDPYAQPGVGPPGGAGAGDDSPPPDQAVR